MKKISLLFVCFVFICSNIFCQMNIIPLWEKNIPNYQKSDEKETQEKGDMLWLEKIQKPTLEIFLPAKGNATGQAVVICPGGGYVGLAYDWEGTDIAKWLNSKGIAAFVLKYRMPQAKSVTESHSAPFKDVQRAIRIVRHRAEEWNIQKDKVGVIGFSAGGHLASTLGTHFEGENSKNKDATDQHNDRPDFMALVYPVISMDPTFGHMGSRGFLLGKDPSDELVKRYSTELQVSPNTPPTFLIHSADDKSVKVENSIVFYLACIQHGVPVEMHLYPNGGHGYSLALKSGHLKTWTDRFIDWLGSLEEKK